MQTKLGTVTLDYAEDGLVKYAKFTPSIEVPFTKDLISQLETLPSSSEEEKIRLQANLVFASWFSRVSNIELTDMFETPIKSKVVLCEKYKDGKAKTCVLEFAFQEAA